MPTSRIVIFTDLDGTLLDRDTYSFTPALPALQLARNRSIPVIFCSSKTMAEQELLRKQIGIGHPFVVEDGGAVYIPGEYYPFPVSEGERRGRYVIIAFGVPYARIRDTLKKVAAELGIALKGYADLTVEEIMRRTGLDPASAQAARQREYEETIFDQLTVDEAERLGQALASYGLRLSRGGRYLAVLGNHSKGIAVQRLMELYRRQYEDLTFVAIGDSRNDFSMFEVVDQAYLVQKKGGGWEKNPPDKVNLVEGVGPEGWNNVVLELLRE